MASDYDSKPLADTDGLLLFRSTSSSGQNRTNEKGFIVTAQLSGLFFQSSASLGGQDILICYRRNLFHVRGTIIFPGGAADIARQLGISSRVVGLTVTLSAMESTDQHH